MTVVYGVWIGHYEAELAYLFATREAAERYSDDYNRWEVASMNKHLREYVEKYGSSVREWEPQARVMEHVVHGSPVDADPQLYAMIAEEQ